MSKLIKNRVIKLYLFCSLIIYNYSFSQNVKVGATAAVPNASAMLDIDGITGLAQARGLLIPRVTDVQRTAMNPLPAAAQGLIVYQTNTAGTSLEGFYYNISTTVVPNWVYLVGDKTGWLTTGNTGTVAGTNFIGTLDAQDFITKTNGNGFANERMRVLKTGQVVINNTTIASSGGNDVFSVYADGTTNGVTTNISTLGPYAINGYSSGTGAGIYGENTGTGVGVLGISSGYGVYGSTNNNGTLPGVWGENINVAAPALSANTSSYGIFGYTNRVASGTGGVRAILAIVDPLATTGSGYGVQGQITNSSGIGVFGINTATAGAAVGVQGQSASVNSQAIVGIGNTSNGAIPTASTAYGIYGQINGTISGTGIAIGTRGSTISTMTSGDARGIYGSSASGFGIGVFGIASSTTVVATDQPVGIYGRASSRYGFGMEAYNSDLSGTGIITVGNNAPGQYLTAGSGAAFNGTATGAFSRASNAAGGTGMTAISNGGGITTLVSGSGVSGSSTLAGVAGFASSAALANRSGGYFDANAGASYAYVGLVDALGTAYKINGNGIVATIVKNSENKPVNLVCPEAPEALFQDYGQGELVNGKAHITLDPTLSKNIAVNELHPLRVFIQLRGDCKGVYVANETATGFDVIELQGGNSNTKFNWTVTANRADETLPDGTLSKYSSLRFTPSQGPMPTTTVSGVPVSVQRNTVEESELVSGKAVDPAAIPRLKQGKLKNNNQK